MDIYFGLGTADKLKKIKCSDKKKGKMVFIETDLNPLLTAILKIVTVRFTEKYY